MHPLDGFGAPECGLVGFEVDGLAAPGRVLLGARWVALGEVEPERAALSGLEAEVDGADEVRGAEEVRGTEEVRGAAEAGGDDVVDEPVAHPTSIAGTSPAATRPIRPRMRMAPPYVPASHPRTALHRGVGIA